MVKCVLFHKPTNKFFKFNNLYLNHVETCVNINDAKFLSFKQAKNMIESVLQKFDWQIWSIENKIVLKEMLFEFDETKETEIKYLKHRLKELQKK